MKRTVGRVLAVLGCLLAGLALAVLAPTAANATTPGAPGADSSSAGSAGAASTTQQSSDSGPTVHGPRAPRTPHGPTTPSTNTVSVNLGGVTNKPSNSLIIILGITVLAIAPALLMLTTSFTKIIVVLSLTRNALGLQSVPPNQVLAGLALFLSLFVMAPVLSAVNHDGVQPYLHGDKTQSVAWHDGVQPLRTFMLDHTRKDDLAMLVSASHEKRPTDRDHVALTTLIPAFVLSELKSAFIIGFVIFLPFLLIDLVVSSSLMSMGMMMVPPVLVSLPFKLLLFVLVDGWALVAHSLVSSYA